MRILVVDDDSVTLNLIATILRLAEYEVTCTNSGLDAIFLLRNHPDLMIIDMMMPGVDGHRVINELGPTRPKVILMSAHEIKLDEDIGLEEKSKIDGFLKKPFGLKGLLNEIQKITGLPHPKPLETIEE